MTLTIQDRLGNINTVKDQEVIKWFNNVHFFNQEVKITICSENEFVLDSTYDGSREACCNRVGDSNMFEVNCSGTVLQITKLK